MTPSDLLKINVNDHTEKKQNLTYLSWAWAWAEALKIDSAANVEVKTFHHDQYTELPYMNVNGTGMVWVTVTLLGTARTCMLPVMDHRNKAILNPDSFQVNTAIMRCMTKALSLHGLGLYIYAGEDLPMESEPVKVMPVDAQTGEAKGEVQMDTGLADANAQLFADSIIKYSSIVKDVKDLNSYWKANQAQLDKLKANYPELYEDVRSKFAEVKQQFSQPKE
jgi:hypothetical protein